MLIYIFLNIYSPKSLVKKLNIISVQAEFPAAPFVTSRVSQFSVGNIKIKILTIYPVLHLQPSRLLAARGVTPPGTSEREAWELPSVS